MSSRQGNGSRPIAGDFVKGAISGLIATAPMTIAMLAGHRQLPRRERYPLPPREIITSILTKLHLRPHVGPRARKFATYAAHFGYGSAMGALYSVAARRGGPGSGVLHGIIVWAVSYLALLPALGILKPATEHPQRRNLLMIAAHLVWGIVTGGLVQLFKSPTPR
jgi:hypothetical protein